MITVNQSGTTIAGTFDSKHLLWLSDIILSEFSCTRQIDEQSAYVFNMPSCDYILILGCDFPCKTGLAVDFSSSLLNAMKPRKYWDDLLSACFILCNEDDCFTTDIKESKYEYVDADEVAAQQKHLSSKQQGELADIVQVHEALDGTLGWYPHCKVHLDLEPGARPVHQHPYSIAHANEMVFIDHELEQLCTIAVLE
jgi:hypothetical protein